MPSTIQITFQTQALDFGPLTRGLVRIRFNDGTNIFNLEENLVQTIPFAYQFQEVPWVGGLEDSVNFGQATNFANAFRRDHRFVGSNLSPTPGKGNISVIVTGNVVTLTAILGTWETTGNTYTGNVLIVNIGAPDNATPETNPLFAAIATNDGDCDVIEYTTTATSGTSPYSLHRNGIVIQTGWNGVSQNIALVRGQVSKLFVTDATGKVSSSITINVPRKLIASEFETLIVPNPVSADLTINNTNPVAGTTPLEYSIDEVDATTGDNYQTNNVFAGVLEGTYRLFVKDKFGCEVSRLFVVSTIADPLNANLPRTFIISDFNSLAFSKQDSKRRGYLNTLSFDENVGLKKQALFHFAEENEIQTQFKSSYPFHVITLFKCDGTKEELSFLLVQENLGVSQKVDCKLFLVSGKIGVYFDGGNEYAPSTTTVIGSSPYVAGLPVWAEIGQFVSIDGIGTKEIEGIGYDSDLGRMYFTVTGIIASPEDGKIQVIYNRHPYNVFRFDFPMTKITGKGFVRIEAGFAFDEIDQVWQSETIKRLPVKDILEGKFIQMVWTGFKTLENFIFDNSYTGVMWIKGKIRPYPISEAKTFDGADEVYSLDQVARMGQKVTIPLMTAKQWNKFNLVSGITQGGTLWIEDMELVRIGSVESEEIGDTNFYNIECEFGYTGNALTIGADELIFNPSTGVVGSGGTGKEPILGWEGFLRLMLNDGTFIRLENGSFVALD